MYRLSRGSDSSVYHVWSALWKINCVSLAGTVESSIDGEKERIEIRNGDHEFATGPFTSILIVFFDPWWCMLDSPLDW